jgi:hypothetical protein
MKKFNHIKKLLIVGTIFGSLVYGNTQIKSVDIYKNKIVLNQELSLDKNSVDLIGEIKLEDIKFDMDKSCQIKNIDFTTIDLKKNELDNLIPQLEEKISQLENKKKANEVNIKYLENLKIQNIENIDILKQSSSFVLDSVSKSYDEIYSLNKKIDEYKKELIDLQNSSSNSSFTRLDYNVICKNTDNVVISYPTKLFKIDKSSDISYDSNNKKLQLKNNLYITQTTGVNLKDIVLNLYTSNYYDIIKPYRFIPLYLDIENQRPIPLRADMVMERASLIKAKVMEAPVSEYLELTTKVVTKISNVNLELAKKTKIEVFSEEFDAKDSLEIDGYSSSNAFYKVEFTSDKIFESIFANIYLDGVFIGKNNVEQIKKDEKNSIYFGTNSFINIEKEIIKDMKEEPFFSLNKLKTEKIWKYKIKNSGKSTEKITLLERVPVSKHEDIKVKVLGDTKYTKLDKNGKIYYDFELKPNETKSIEFGYEIEKPSNKK